MQTKKTYSTTSRYLLRFLIVVSIGTTYWAFSQFQTTNKIYEDIDTHAAQEATVANKASINGVEFAIPTYSLFKNGEIWELVSKKVPLKGDADYDLIKLSLPHGDQELDMQIASEIADELQQLINAAETGGEPLMISSAYRSKDEQQKLYDDFVAKNGKVLAQQYVSPPGSSEHHTGMSVDFASVSEECAVDSDTCSLSQNGAAWLAKNANRFGFIQRYPEGKQQITGVAFEPWHFRFVGKPLAIAMYDSGLTFDEVVMQLAPGYSL